MLLSRGVLTKGPTVLWEGSTASNWPRNLDLGFRWASYSAIYRRHLWVAVLVNKISYASARLPLKVYERQGTGRAEARATPYGRLIQRPNQSIDPFKFWLWTVSTLNVHGEAFWLKRREQGLPVELLPLHPTQVQTEVRDGNVHWLIGANRVEVRRRDLVHFSMFDPDSTVRGMSPLEPLRATLENEEGARRANSAMWRNGARPSVVLKHPGSLSAAAQERLRASWGAIYGGVDNWAKPAVLEEGLEHEVLTLNAEELQYVDGRKLNREEACAAFDVPPPVVHILDRATFSNITEQMRSMYRDTMAPKLGLLESTLEFELRDGRFGERGEPDFGDDFYAEFLLDEVLRGAFEDRTDAYQKAVNSGWMTPAEVREKENLPFIEGSDQLLINSTSVPLAQIDDIAASRASRGNVRSVMGRLGAVESLSEIDPERLVKGLDGSAAVVLAELDRACAEGLTVPQFRDRLRTLEV